MPQIIAPLLAVGTATAAVTAPAVISSNKAIKATEKAADDVRDRAVAEAASVKEAQQTASAQASESVRRRAALRTKTIYTSPLGVSGSASVARKRLLGE